MRTPQQLQPLVDEGLIDEVIRPLMAGKEAEVYLVVADGEICCAKVYKDSESRSFRQRSTYKEGRKVRSSRRQRAMGRGSKFGKAELEAEWQHAEVDALHRLTAAGVRVPTALNFSHGVLLMELITDEYGEVAPRLNDTALTPEIARKYHKSLVRDVVKMLSAGLIHGDLSEYNVLLGPLGPVIIDLPQATNASGNNNAFRLLDRDIANMRSLFARAAPELMETQYAREIWDLYEAGDLHPETVLTGLYVRREANADVDAILDQIQEARLEAEARQLGREEAEQYD